MLETTLAMATIIRSIEIHSMGEDFPVAVPFTTVAERAHPGTGESAELAFQIEVSRDPCMMEMSCSRLLAATRWEARKRCPSTERIDMVSRSAISLFDSPCAASDMISR